MPQVEHRPDVLYREAEQLRQLADQHRERDTVHVAIADPVSYTHLRAHETVLDLVCRLLLAQTKNNTESTATRMHMIDKDVET